MHTTRPRGDRSGHAVELGDARGVSRSPILRRAASFGRPSVASRRM
jgi:hypothetical protein